MGYSGEYVDLKLQQTSLHNQNIELCSFVSNCNSYDASSGYWFDDKGDKLYDINQ